MELHRRIRAAVGTSAPLIFVDDRSPDEAQHVLAELSRSDSKLQICTLRENVGQNLAVLAGFSLAKTEWLINLDADLQDPPEAIPQLLDLAHVGHSDVVFAGRRGRYQSRGRLFTSKVYKKTMSVLTGAPDDAGIFMAAHRSVIERVLALALPRPVLVPLVSFYAKRPSSHPVERARRHEGHSAYSMNKRLEVGLRSLAALTLAHMAERGAPVHVRHDYSSLIERVGV